MTRKIPKRTGPAISNSERHARTANFAQSAAERYMPPTAPKASPNPEPVTSSKPPQKAAKPPSGPTEAKKAPPAAKAAPPSVPQPKATSTLSYYVRALPADIGRIRALAEATGTTINYVEKSLATNLRQRITDCRDRQDWSVHAKDVEARLADKKGEGTAFLRVNIAFTDEQIGALGAHINDPFGTIKPAKILSAYANAYFSDELDRLAKAVSVKT